MKDFKKEKTNFGERTTHPSYGMLSFSRVTGGATNLFGSSIKHRDFISMTLYHGDIERGLNSDWYHGSKIIAEAEMSYAQFAEAITSMNVGSGIPVTIKRTEKDGLIPECNFINKREQSQDEFSERMDHANQKMDRLVKEIQALFLEKKSIGKADKENIMNRLSEIQAEVSKNSKFALGCFNEQIEKTVTEAKAEIEAFCQNKMNSIAQAALANQTEEIKRLKSPVDIEL